MNTNIALAECWDDMSEEIGDAVLEPLKMRLQQIIDAMGNKKLWANLNSEKLINELFYICTRIERDRLSAKDIHVLLEDIKVDLGSYHAANIVMMGVCCVMQERTDLPYEVLGLLRKLEKKYKLRPEMKNLQELFPIKKMKISACHPYFLFKVQHADINVNCPGNQIIHNQDNKYNHKEKIEYGE